MKMKCQRNVYANPLEHDYAATDHLRLWKATFYTPTKGWRILPRTRMLTRLRATPASIHQGAINLHCDEDLEDKIKLLDPRVQKLIRTYLEVFGDLPPQASCDKLVQMDLKLKPEWMDHKICRRPYPAPKEQADETERQIQECIDGGLVLEYKNGDYPQHCSPCFLVAKPGSTAKRLVVDYGELNKKALNHSGSIPNMESTLEKIAPCRYKTKMDKRSGFWQVDLMLNAQ